jgi:hypothetical protein
LISELFDRCKDRFRLHHHPLTSAKRRIISNVMFVHRPIAQVMNVKIDNSVLLRAFHNAFAKRGAANFREQRDDVDLHQLGKRRTPNTQRPTLNCRALL